MGVLLSCTHKDDRLTRLIHLEGRGKRGKKEGEEGRKGDRGYECVCHIAERNAILACTPNTH